MLTCSAGRVKRWYAMSSRRRVEADIGQRAVSVIGDLPIRLLIVVVTCFHVELDTQHRSIVLDARDSEN